MEISRDFVATGFVVHEDKVLLIKHKKLEFWLPPGGHIEKDELPIEALKREIKEETGLDVEVFGDKDSDGDDEQVKVIPRPNHIQIEKIRPGHEHMDLIWFTNSFTVMSELRV